MVKVLEKKILKNGFLGQKMRKFSKFISDSMLFALFRALLHIFKRHSWPWIRLYLLLRIHCWKQQKNQDSIFPNSWYFSFGSLGKSLMKQLLQNQLWIIMSKYRYFHDNELFRKQTVLWTVASFNLNLRYSLFLFQKLPTMQASA